jgi:hypothetical protein
MPNPIQKEKENVPGGFKKCSASVLKDAPLLKPWVKATVERVGGMGSHLYS